MLVPALFYGAEKGDALMHKLRGIQWRIAYPYAPQRKNGEAWRKPMDVWAGAACEFLTVLGEDSTKSKILLDAVLSWEQDLSLLPRPNEREILNRVYITDGMRP